MTTLNDEQRRQIQLEKDKLRAQYKRMVELGQVDHKKVKAAQAERAATVTQTLIVNQRDPLISPIMRLFVLAFALGSVLLATALFLRGWTVQESLLIGVSSFTTLIIMGIVQVIAYKLYWQLTGCFWAVFTVLFIASALMLLLGYGELPDRSMVFR